MKIRRLEVEDSELGVDALRLLKAPDGYPIPTLEHMSEFLRRPQNVLIVATRDEKPVGFVVAYLLDRIDREQPMMFFYEIGVAMAHRRQGIGKALIGNLKEICRDHDVMKMCVPTGSSNVAARATLQHCCKPLKLRRRSDIRLFT